MLTDEKQIENNCDPGCVVTQPLPMISLDNYSRCGKWEQAARDGLYWEQESSVREMTATEYLKEGVVSSRGWLVPQVRGTEHVH